MSIIPDCKHDSILWDDVTVEYYPDGNVYVWREGRCTECRNLIQMDYTPGLKVIVGGEVEDDLDE